MPDGEAEKGSRQSSWGRARLQAGIVFLLGVLGLAYAPDFLAEYLSGRVSDDVRDVLVTACWAVFLVGVSWVFVALQRRGSG